MIRAAFLVILLVALMVTPSFAYEDVGEYITPEMEEYLPSDIIDEDNVINYDSLSDRLFSGMADMVKAVVSRLFTILGVVILTAVFSVYANTVCGEGLRKCFSFLSSAVVVIILFGILSDIWEEMSRLLEQINGFMTGLTPVTTVLYSLGGNVTTAAVNDSAMSLILTVFEKLCYHGIKPMLQICFGFSIASALSGNVNLKPISGLVRKTYTTVLVFSMSMMTCILSLQNLLTRSSDSLAMRTVKFASASSVPLVGGCLGEATETVAAGVISIRSTFGVLAILAIGIMVLPGILSLWLNKMAFSIGATLSSVFGLGKESELINDACELVNFAIAITVSCSVMFIICVAVFANASAAIGG